MKYFQHNSSSEPAYKALWDLVLLISLASSHTYSILPFQLQPWQPYCSSPFIYIFSNKRIPVSRFLHLYELCLISPLFSCLSTYFLLIFQRPLENSLPEKVFLNFQSKLCCQYIHIHISLYFHLWNFFYAAMYYYLNIHLPSQWDCKLCDTQKFISLKAYYGIN